jgi:prevent-host-death family protein
MNKLSPKKWALQDAKAKFSELVERTVKEGPQVVTKRGVSTIVTMPYDEWQRVSHSAGPSLKDLLRNAPKDAAFARALGKRRKVKLPPPPALG